MKITTMPTFFLKKKKEEKIDINHLTHRKITIIPLVSP